MAVPRFRVSALVLVLFSVGVSCVGTGAVGCGFGGTPAGDSGTASAPAPGGARTVTVAANRGWQDTGIQVQPQQKFQLRYRSGAIVDKDVKIADAHGSDYICGD